MKEERRKKKDERRKKKEERRKKEEEEERWVDVVKVLYSMQSEKRRKLKSPQFEWAWPHVTRTCLWVAVKIE